MKISIDQLEQFWQAPIPVTFRKLHEGMHLHWAEPTCSFLDISELVGDDVRWRGMIPQFLPFAEDEDGCVFGFYSDHIEGRMDYPVYRWDPVYDHFLPVASTFDSFLRWCMIRRRMDASDDPDAKESELIRAMETVLGSLNLSNLPLKMPTPRNENECNEQIVKVDSQNSQALANIGCMYLNKGDSEKARDYLARSSEAAPRFADPYFLMAETYSLAGDEARAALSLWNVLRTPMAFCGRAAKYDLGADREDEDIYALALTQLAAETTSTDKENTRLWKFIRQENPFRSADRLELGTQLMLDNDMDGSERELLNALLLATEESDVDEAYKRLIVLYEGLNRHRDAVICKHDRSLVD